MMFRYRKFCFLDLLVISLQFFAAVSAATIDYPGRSLHSDHSHEKTGTVERTLTARDTKITPGLDRPTLLVAKGNQSSATPQKWSVLNDGRPIDFKPLSGNVTIRVRRRPNAATINLDQLYNLNLQCLYEIFKFVAPTRKRVLDAELVVCNALRTSFLGFMSEAPSSQAISVPVAVDSMMAYELYNNTGSGLRLIATGCVAYQDCGQIPPIESKATFSPITSTHNQITDSNMNVSYQFFPTPAYEPSIPPGQFADVAHVFYRSLFRRLFSLALTANLTMPAEPAFLHAPPLHPTQMWEGNNYNLLQMVFAQVYDSQYQFTLLDVNELIYDGLWSRLGDGRLKNGARGYLNKDIEGYPKQPKRTGEFCVWHILSGPNLCNKIFELDPNDHPGRDHGDHGEKYGTTATA